MLQWLYIYVASFCSQCFIYFFGRVLQVCLFGCCICVYTYVTSILSGCCVCFTMVFKCFHVFLQVFQRHVSSVSSAFRRMLQVLHLDVSKVNRVLHILQCDLLVVVAGGGARGRGVRRGADVAWSWARAQTPCGVGWA